MDIWFAGARVAVFVDGCFWHGCDIHGSLPASNRERWLAKMKDNKARDIAVGRHLATLGIVPLRFWEHDDIVEAATTVQSIVVERTRAGLSAPAGVDRG